MNLKSMFSHPGTVTPSIYAISVLNEYAALLSQDHHKVSRHHHGEAGGAYDEVVTISDDFIWVWEQHIAAPALAHLNALLIQWMSPGTVALEDV